MASLAELLRLIVITDAQLAGSRSITSIVAECLEAGARAIQLRDKHASARALYEQALTLRQLTARYQALLFINDRFDVALAARADGVHVGPDDLSVSAVRRAAPPSFLIGCSADEPRVAQRFQKEGADYIGCGAVFGTLSKAEAAGERIGTERLRAVVNAVSIPVVGVGGVDATNAALVAKTGAAGAAVLRAVMSASDVARTVSDLLSVFAGRPGA